MMRVVGRAALAVAGSWLLGACDPCFGTTSCGSTAPRLVINGQIVRAVDGSGVDGVRIDAVRTGGVRLASDSFSVTTSGGGFWRIESSAQESGEAELTFRVASAALKHPYVVAKRRVGTVSRGGDAAVFERWVDAPYLPYSVQLYYRGSDVPVRLIEVEFHRRGSTWLRGPAVKDSVAFSRTDEGAGQAALFSGVAVVDDTGDVVGDLFVYLPQPLGTSVIRNLRLPPTHVYHAGGLGLRMGVGPSLAYAIQLYDRRAGSVLPGVSFEIRRVGGIPVVPEVVTGVSDKDGYLRFPFRALAAGALIVDLTVHPPSGITETFRDTIPTFDSDAGRLFTNLSLGPYLNYYGILRAGFGHDLVGVPVRVRRTGGIQVSPADTTVLTNSLGGVQLNAMPSGVGDVVFELTFNPPAPYPRFIVRNLTVTTMQRDFPQGKVVWVWDLTLPISGPPGTEIVILP